MQFFKFPDVAVARRKIDWSVKVPSEIGINKHLGTGMLSRRTEEEKDAVKLSETGADG